MYGSILCGRRFVGRRDVIAQVSSAAPGTKSAATTPGGSSRGYRALPLSRAHPEEYLRETRVISDFFEVMTRGLLARQLPRLPSPQVAHQ